MKHASVTTLMYRNPYILLLSIIILLVAGFSALQNLPRLEDPRITHRNPIIFTFFPGASAERVEALVTKSIEDKLRELHEIKKIEPTSRDGASVIALELQDWVGANENEQVFSKIRDKLEEAANQFPPGASKPNLDDQRGASAFTLIVGLTLKEQDSNHLNILNRLSKELADRLRNVSGTEIVRLFGEPEEEIRVIVAEDQLAALGLNHVRLASMIASSDSKQSSGAFRSELHSLFIEVAGELNSLERIAAIPVGHTQYGGTLHLIQWPILRGGSIRANIQVKEAQAEAAVYQYEQQVLFAI